MEVEKRVTLVNKEGEVAPLNVGSLYEVNQQLMNEEKKMSTYAVKKKLQQVKNFLTRNNKYFMLLCHEARDYTIFELKGKSPYDCAISDLFECLNNRGDILAIDYQKDGNAYEIWIRRNDQELPRAYYFFPYDEGVIVCS